MAIRDRITVKTKDGFTTVIQAKKAGGRVESREAKGQLVVEEYGQARDPIQTLTVSLTELVWYRFETDVPPDADAKKPARRRKAE